MSSERPTSSSQFHMVDLFAGPGGLDVAARWLGIDAIGLEWDDNACATRAAAGLKTEQGDVAEHSDKDFAPKDAAVTRILTGGPPCQTYTVAGTGVGRQWIGPIIDMIDDMIAMRDIDEALWQLNADTGDERTGLVLQPLRWALEAYAADRPYDAIVLEQVPQVLPIWEQVGRALRSLGYSVAHGILRTEEYGVPQTRRRAILIARLAGLAELPKATHRRYTKGIDKKEGDPALLEWRSMRDVLPDLGDFDVVSNYGTGGDPKLRGRRNCGLPSATVTGKISRNRLVEPDTNWDLGRRFEPEEAGILQTFPKFYPWTGKDKSQQIGNAIPPRLAVHVLAAALGKSVDTAELDAAVDTPWDVDDPSSTTGIVRLIDSDVPAEKPLSLWADA